MKFIFGKYPTRLTCDIYKSYMDKKYSHRRPIKQARFENLLEAAEDAVQWVYNVINRLYFDKRKQKVKLRLDYHDTWALDYTLAHIVVPALKQLKETKRGLPIVDVDDLPEDLRPTRGEEDTGIVDDNLHHARWLWVMDEMIWAFEQVLSNEESLYSTSYDRDMWTQYQDRVQRGTTLFGKYFRSLWD